MNYLKTNHLKVSYGLILVGLASLALLLAVACASEPPPTKQEVLVSLTDDLILPRFESLAGEMGELRDSLHTLCAAPTASNLEAARNAWRDARTPWMRSQAVWFGPVMDRRSRSLVDWAPVEPERVETLLVERETLSEIEVREFLSSTQRGMGVIEYLLFENDQAVLGQLAQPDGKRCQYLSALGDVAAEETDGVLADWRGDSAGSGYAAYLNGTGSISLLEQAALDEVVRTSVFLTRSLADMRLGKALGADGVDADPAVIPGARAATPWPTCGTRFWACRTFTWASKPARLTAWVSACWSGVCLRRPTTACAPISRPP